MILGAAVVGITVQANSATSFHRRGKPGTFPYVAAAHDRGATEDVVIRPDVATRLAGSGHRTLASVATVRYSIPFRSYSVIPSALLGLAFCMNSRFEARQQRAPVFSLETCSYSRQHAARTRSSTDRSVTCSYRRLAQACLHLADDVAQGIARKSNVAASLCVQGRVIAFPRMSMACGCLSERVLGSIQDSRLLLD